MFTSLIQTALQSLMFFALHFENSNSFPKQLSRKEEESCIAAIANGDQEARNRLIEHNLRLVAFIVKKHYSDSKEQDDLISIGIIGLIKATETFDYNRNINFSTYASKCINNQIRMHFRKIKHQSTEVYMDAPIDSDSEGNIITIADIFKDNANVADEVDLKINMQKLYKYINEELDQRETEIIAKRYGIANNSYSVQKIQTQREVAKELGISRSYVSRIEKRALEKLKYRFDKG